MGGTGLYQNPAQQCEICYHTRQWWNCMRAINAASKTAKLKFWRSSAENICKLAVQYQNETEQKQREGESSSERSSSEASSKKHFEAPEKTMQECAESAKKYMITKYEMYRNAGYDECDCIFEELDYKRAGSNLPPLRPLRNKEPWCYYHHRHHQRQGATCIMRRRLSEHQKRDSAVMWDLYEQTIRAGYRPNA